MIDYLDLKLSDEVRGITSRNAFLTGLLNSIDTPGKSHNPNVTDNTIRCMTLHVIRALATQKDPKWKNSKGEIPFRVRSDID